jgi:hypothetical protein
MGEQHHLLISHSSAHEIIQNRLGFHEVGAIWLPNKLSEEHKRKTLTICQGLPTKLYVEPPLRSRKQTVIYRMKTSDMRICSQNFKI